MHVNAKLVAMGGLMLAFTEAGIALGSVIESNTLFLLAAASFLVGIMIREAGLRFGGGFLIAGMLLGILIAPNKFYVFTYTGMGCYIWIREMLWEWLAKASEKVNRMKLFWFFKILTFNVVFIMGIAFGWKLFAEKEVSWQIVLGIAAAGQIGFLLYDMAYEYVQRQIWSKIRGKIL